MGDKKENGHSKSLDDCLNQHCSIQFPTDVGSRNNNWVQNDCVQHPRVQIFTDASKRGKDTGYAFLASQGDVVIGEGGGALGDVSVYQAEVVGRAAMADLESPQTQRDEGEAVDGLTICSTIHLLPEAHQ